MSLRQDYNKWFASSEYEPRSLKKLSDLEIGAPNNTRTACIIKDTVNVTAHAWRNIYFIYCIHFNIRIVCLLSMIEHALSTFCCHRRPFASFCLPLYLGWINQATSALFGPPTSFVQYRRLHRCKPKSMLDLESMVPGKDVGVDHATRAPEKSC